MDRSDRMVVDLLGHYAFVLHEDIMELSDEEIQLARNFADNYLEKNWKWKSYNSEYELFVNHQIFKAITNCDYSCLEDKLYKEISSINNIMGISDWNFKVYYSLDYENNLLLSKPDEYGINCYINIIYDIRNETLSACNIKVTDDMKELGDINYTHYVFDNLKLTSDVDGDIKI